MTQEPTVWDYVKALLTPWQGPPPEIPGLSEGVRAGTFQRINEAGPDDSLPTPALPAGRWPWFSLLALALALIAQYSLEPTSGVARQWLLGALAYGVAALWLLAALYRNEFALPVHRPDGNGKDPETVRGLPLLIGLVLSSAAFFTLGGGKFTPVNVFLWLTGLLAMLWAFWLSEPAKNWQTRWAAWRAMALRPSWKVVIARWSLICLAVLGLVLFFRFYRLDEVPPQMTSDHAEKLLDVWDVLHGKPNIFFIRNTGREPLQFYLTALMVQVFDTGYSFLSLKLGTTLLGLLLVVYLYALGKEVGNRRVGLFAMLLGGSSYWLNGITRIALRFSLLPLFVAPVMFHLLRGLRTRNRNHLLLAGLFLGTGLHGYSPYRVVPLLVLVAVVLYLLHAQSKGAATQTLWGLILLIVISVLVFLPIIRYITDPSNPYKEMFFFRAATRLTGAEQAIEGNPLLIFANNLWRALIMFFWDNGPVWSISIMGRPALDVISAALYFLGGAALFVRYLVKRHWLDITLLLSIPILLLGSALALAFPNENPIMNRTAGALVPVFVIAALGLEGVFAALEKWRPDGLGRRAGWVVVLALAFFATRQNYDLIFNQYQAQYTANSWNTTEIGAVIADFAESVGSYESAWVIPYPHWVDTRLVGMNAGQPVRDYALARENIVQTTGIPLHKLFIFYPDDFESQRILEQFYPQGTLKVYQSDVGKNFWLYFVPASESTAPLDPNIDEMRQP
jgi:4-amino-4-deoxy-L-arabinose transferase-like glycosyltransferase